MLRQCYFKLKYIRTLLICSKMAYNCCFSQGEKLDFLELFRKKFYNYDYRMSSLYVMILPWLPSTLQILPKISLLYESKRVNVAISSDASIGAKRVSGSIPVSELVAGKISASSSMKPSSCCGCCRGLKISEPFKKLENLSLKVRSDELHKIHLGSPILMHA